ncbi:MAG: 3-oxoacyl-[acyl-carrier-protein] reductase [Candidatus Hydrogenedens sp.]|nr:3-oxoacyl-[acyl-carrier-protein] reductase [Candidatus Hydrogenedens sp.]
MKPLEGKVALVTGGTRGIGNAIVRLFVQQGAQVAFCGRSEEEAKKVARSLGGESLGLGCDVSRHEEVQALVARVQERWGTIHILVNNAGIVLDGLLMRMKEERWDQVIQSNLNSVFHCCKATAPLMVKQRYGRIITIGSVAALRGNAGQCAYTASKAALVGFTKSYAREMASRNITVNLLAPGLIETDMTASLPTGLQEALISQIPLKRAGTVEEVASAVAFLASDEAAYITGTVLRVDGGLGS